MGIADVPAQYFEGKGSFLNFDRVRMAWVPLTGNGAAGEFQKLIDNPGLCWVSINGPLARLQLGRAQRLMGDNASARKWYEDFLTLWKDADPDVPIYQQAKAEYAKLGK